jgi:Tfp pilus assembly protein PilF
MLRHALLLCCALLGACAGTPPPATPMATPAPSFLRDDAFAAPAVRIDAADVFAPSEDMLAFLRGPGAKDLRDPDPRGALIDLLYRRQRLALEYDASVTRNAAEAFEARAGNCLSLVIMTASFAKAIGVPVRYQRVLVDENWTRSGDLYFASGHVNLTLDTNPLPSRAIRAYEPPLVVDFLPAAELRGQRTQPVSEATIVAMFMNNRAAEALAGGRLDDAYGWAREALAQDPTFLAGRNTLGVIYLRRGLAADAERVFADVLAQEPENVKALGNRIAALQALGRADDAARLAVQLARIEPTPPFHWFNLGLAAMRERDFAAARELFLKEVRREAYYHEFRFWLAQAELALGNVREARHQLDLARHASTTPHDQQLYAAKLDRLKALGVQ